MRASSWLVLAFASPFALLPFWPAAARRGRGAEGERGYASFVRAQERERRPEPSPPPSPLASELEAAHVARRNGAWEEALERYEALAWGVADMRVRGRAEYWRARTLELSGRPSDARRAWSVLAEHARDACERLRAWDHLALSLEDSGERDEALHALARCLEMCAPRAAEQSEQGARVARALASMRAPTALGLDAWPESACPAPASSTSEAREKSPELEVDCSQAPLR